MSYAIDVIIVAIMLFFAVRGMKKGFIKALFSIISFLLALILTFIFASPFASYAKNTEVVKSIYASLTDSFSEYIDEKIGTAANKTTDSIIAVLNLPDFIANSSSLSVKSNFFDRNNNSESYGAATAVAEAVGDSCFRAICSVSLFVILCLAIFILRKLLELIFKLPLLNSVNKGLGAFAGLLNGFIISYILISLLSAAACSPSAAWLSEALEHSYIAGFMYEKNLILSILS